MIALPIAQKFQFREVKMMSEKKDQVIVLSTAVFELTFALLNATF